MTIRVVIAEDHHLVRDGIRALLDRADDMQVIGEAVNGADAVTLVERLKPDVVVMDVTMPGQNGIEATRIIRSAGHVTEVVILSMHTDPALVRKALQVGAKAYVLKGSVTEELLLAVRSAFQGATYLSPAASESILETDVSVTESNATDILTPREMEVLQLIGEGLTNRAIGKQLSISVKTVERHRTKLMAKLDAHSIVELMREAFRRGLLNVDG
jgi:DNA-binding NarL/FixJ family response regulator